jgi:membrane protein DedA with SNARE-associated domain
MAFDINSLLMFIQTGGYFLMLIIMLIEGPVITAIAAFAASQGIFNIYIVLLLSIIGSVGGDIVFYLLGKYSKKFIIRVYEKFTKSRGRHIRKLKTLLKNHLGKAILVIKVTPNIQLPGLALAGTLNVPFGRYFFFSTIISFFYCLFFLLLGFYAGVAFSSIIKYFKYLEIAIAALVIFMIILSYTYKKYSNEIFKKLRAWVKWY